MYTLRSNIDKQIFHVNQKVIDSSVLLTKLCESTENTEPIELNCSSRYLEVYIQLINHYDAITDFHDSEFEKKLLFWFPVDTIVEMIKALGDLESDFFNDAIADLLLFRIEGKNWKEVRKFFDLENDFSSKERKEIGYSRLEYLISMNKGKIQFPFKNKNFAKLKNKFFCPGNDILRRVIERSNEKTSFVLSLTNKTIKNEVDKLPIKVTNFCYKVGSVFANHLWLIDVKVDGDYFWHVQYANFKQQYIDIIKTRKVIPFSKVKMEVGQKLYDKEKEFLSLDFILPKSSTFKIIFENQTFNEISFFDIQKWDFASIWYTLKDMQINFDRFYQNFIAKDLSKEIKIKAHGVFEFLEQEEILEAFKKSSASKFHEILIISSKKEKSNNTVLPEFRDFILNYMEDDGIIKSEKSLFIIRNSYDRSKKQYIYRIPVVKKYLEKN